MIRIVYVVITTLWIQVPSQDWDSEGARPYLTRDERAFIVDSPNEVAVNLWKMNEEAKERDAKYTAVLLRIDLETGKTDTVQIPTIRFLER